MNSGGCSALGRLYHQECFKCFTCQKPLGEKFFTTGSEQPSCEECFQKLHCPKCGICNQPVSSEGVVIKDKEEDVFHSDCLKCSKCFNPPEGKFFTMDEEIICEGCIAKEVTKLNIDKVFMNYDIMYDHSWARNNATSVVK